MRSKNQFPVKCVIQLTYISDVDKILTKQDVASLAEQPYLDIFLKGYEICYDEQVILECKDE